MKFTAPGASSRSITVDRKFLSSVYDVLQSNREDARSEILIARGVPAAEVPALLGANPELVDNFDTRYELQRINNLSFRFEAEFVNGRQIESTDFDEFVGRLDKTASSPKRIVMEFSTSWATSTRVEVSHAREGVRYTIDGNEKLAIGYENRIVEAINSAESDYQFLYGKWPQRLITIVCIVTWTLLLRLTFINYSVLSSVVSFQLWTVAYTISLAIPLIWASIIQSVYASYFSPLKFSWGVDEARKKSGIKLAFSLTSIIVIPVILAIATVLAS